MIVCDLTFATICEGLVPVCDEWYEEVIPREVELLTDTQYAPQYSWMFSYEKRLKYRIEKAIGHRLGALERELFGPDGAFSESLSNAFVHGHKRDPNQTIKVRCTVSSKGIAFSISDQGCGFDVRQIVGAAENGSTYASFGGNGMRALCRREAIVASFCNEGRTVNIRLNLLAANSTGNRDSI